MSKTLIIGGGYLATVIQKTIPGSVIIDFPSIDITSIASVTQNFELHKPDLVINAAAYTNTAEAELPENMGKVFALNVQGPANIAYVAKKMQIPWVHFSTGMFFDGDEVVSEEIVPNPEGYYAWTKAWADALLIPRAQEAKTLILRIHLPISALSHPRNFLNRMMKFDKAVDVDSSITVVEDLIAAMQYLIAHNRYGLYNAVNTGYTSSFAIAEALNKNGLRTTLPTKMTRNELDAMGGAKQVFPKLSTDKLAKTGFTMPSIQEALERSIKNFS